MVMHFISMCVDGSMAVPVGRIQTRYCESSDDVCLAVEAEYSLPPKYSFGRDGYGCLRTGWVRYGGQTRVAVQGSPGVRCTGVRVGADCKGRVSQAMPADDHSFCRENFYARVFNDILLPDVSRFTPGFCGGSVVSSCQAAGPGKPAKRDCHVRAGIHGGRGLDSLCIFSSADPPRSRGEEVTTPPRTPPPGTNSAIKGVVRRRPYGRMLESLKRFRITSLIRFQSCNAS